MRPRRVGEVTGSRGFKVTGFCLCKLSVSGGSVGGVVAQADPGASDPCHWGPAQGFWTQVAKGFFVFFF